MLEQILRLLEKAVRYMCLETGIQFQYNYLCNIVLLASAGNTEFYFTLKKKKC